MSTFVKVFSSILDSTVWLTPKHVRLVWMTMMVMADRDGVVEASVPGLANRAGVTREECDEALEMFLSPDPDSRTPDEEGRRIRKVDGGWELINHSKYRDRMNAEERKERDAARKNKKRAEERVTLADVLDGPRPSDPVRERPQVSAPVRSGPSVSKKVRDVSHADAEADPNSECESEPAPTRPIPVQEMLGKPSPGPNLMSRIIEAMSQETFAIAGERRAAAPKEAHAMWDGWREIARYVRDTGKVREWPDEETIANGRALVRAFYDSKDPRTVASIYKLTFLKGNPAQYAAEAASVAA